ncbi:TetR/AcrR family transcriptional regulator [Acidimangrovimonas sediminis]|uniref:TetR/AcrR family transcriptional regulator n=1 Tax=Acidimangrovimonas sediminis TaxID=2056283 RepID=UPI001304CE75|nr:TetR/AcrR family transcriptional regulator [Acidimangrovimonas sediminis]
MTEANEIVEAQEDVARSPRLEQRRSAFLGAAADVFLKKGFARATLDDIIRQSGGSRQTLYELFGGKQGLFEALLEERSCSVFKSFLFRDRMDDPPEAFLASLGETLIEMLTMPQALAMFRLMVSESMDDDRLAQQFWESGPGRSREALAIYLRRQHDKGALRVDDPQAAAQQFLGSVVAHFQLLCLLRIQDPPTPEQRRVYVAGAVSRFLDGCRAQ